MCSLCQLLVAKNHNLGQMLTFGGLLYRPPFTDESQIWCAIADPKCTFSCQNSSRSVYSIALWRRKTPVFAIFWTSTFSDVDSLAAIWESWTRVHNYKPSLIQQRQNHSCTPTPSWQNWANKLWHSKVWRTNQAWWTDKKLNVFRHPGGGWNPSPTKLGLVIEDLEHVLAPQKRLRVWRIVSPLGGTENLEVTRPHQIKNPITP